jgi:hypothetical protein
VHNCQASRLFYYNPLLNPFFSFINIAELLRELLKADPKSKELLEFVEFDENVGEAVVSVADTSAGTAQASVGSATLDAPSSNPAAETTNNIATKEQPSSKDTSPAISSTSTQYGSKLTRLQCDEKVRDAVPIISMVSLFVAVVLYSQLVHFDIVDISHTTSGKQY